MFKVGDVIDCVITEIDKEKRRVAISHRLTKENPYETLEKNYPVGSEIEGKISSINEYAIYLNIESFDIDVFLHSNDLSYTCLLYTSPSPRDRLLSRMPSSA